MGYGVHKSVSDTWTNGQSALPGPYWRMLGDKYMDLRKYEIVKSRYWQLDANTNNHVQLAQLI